MNRPLPDAPYDDADLAAAIDASFGDGPTPPSLDELLMAGRRARRRRTTTRAALGGAVAAGVLVAVSVSTGGWDLTGASPGDTGVATAPSNAPTGAPPSTETEPPPLPAGTELGISFGPDGGLQTRPGTVLVRRMLDPLPDTGAERSYALELERDDRRYWVIAEWSREGELISFDPAGKGFDRFEDWVAHRVDAAVGGTRSLVVLTDGGSLRPAPGVELLAQEQDIDLGPRFAGPEDRTAAAEVREAGRRWYVLVRDSADGPPDYITVDPAASAPTFDEFLTDAAETYSAQSDGSSEGYR